MDKRYHYKGNKSLYGLLIASKPYDLCTFRKVFGTNSLSIQLFFIHKWWYSMIFPFSIFVWCLILRLSSKSTKLILISMFLFGLILESLMSISLNDKMRNHILQDNLCKDTHIGDVGDNVILKMLMKCI